MTITERNIENKKRRKSRDTDQMKEVVKVNSLIRYVTKSECAHTYTIKVGREFHEAITYCHTVT